MIDYNEIDKAIQLAHDNGYNEGYHEGYEEGYKIAMNIERYGG